MLKSFHLDLFVGLPYLLVKGVYKDAFILHDQSVADPANIRIKEKFPDQYANLVSCFFYKTSRNV